MHIEAKSDPIKRGIRGDKGRNVGWKKQIEKGGREREENEKPNSIKKGLNIAVDKLGEGKICKGKGKIIRFKVFP